MAVVENKNTGLIYPMLDVYLNVEIFIHASLTEYKKIIHKRCSIIVFLLKNNYDK